MSTPLVSVVIAAWNAADFLPETLATAVGQTWPNLEIIVVDDGSTDGTREAIAAFLPRIRYERRPHRGLAAARNEGIRLAKGEYVALLDADDLWHPEKIATQVAVAARNPGTGLVACNGVEFDGADIVRETLLFEPFTRAIAESPGGEVTRDFQRELITSCGISCPSQVMFPRAVLDETGPFIDSGAQDYDYYLRVSRDSPITLHHHEHARWRYRAGSMSGARAYRLIGWGLDTLPVLRAHRRRARPEHLGLIDQRLREVSSTVSYMLMLRGRERGRVAAMREMLRLLIAWPSRATTVKHLAGLWTPPGLYASAGQLLRRAHAAE